MGDLGNGQANSKQLTDEGKCTGKVRDPSEGKLCWEVILSFCIPFLRKLGNYFYSISRENLFRSFFSYMSLRSVNLLTLCCIYITSWDFRQCYLLHKDNKQEFH